MVVYLPGGKIVGKRHDLRKIKKDMGWDEELEDWVA
jgi:hypothetical protein